MPGTSSKCRSKAEHAVDAVTLHHCDVQRVAGGERPPTEEDGPSAVDVLGVDRQHVVDDRGQRVERRLDRVRGRLPGSGARSPGTLRRS
jgi:hypothetical protein